MHIRGYFGVLLLICIGIIFSTDRKRINARIIVSCLLLQAAIEVLVLRVPAGQALLKAIAGVVTGVLSYGGEGARFCSGRWSGRACTKSFPMGPTSSPFRSCPRWSMSAP
ncbi:Na+ dependent nucleoside transporter N-terminal domain-containing protein [Komagataeibacter rhaeticus]|nr:Na+ dependent nucleoside transporter N-terminal domain-containing protein [Komagataeibacter rhaeticus]